MAKPASPGSFQDPFIVPSPNSFHRAARIKPTVKRAVWQKPLQFTRTPTSKEPLSAQSPANTTPSATITPVKATSGPIQLPTPSTDGKETKLPQPAPFKRAFSLTRFTDPLPTPRTPSCRLSVLEYDTPVPRTPLRFQVETLVAKEHIEVVPEAEVDVVAEVEVEVEKQIKPSRIPVWKGRKTGPSCPACGTRTWSTANTVNTENEKTVEFNTPDEGAKEAASPAGIPPFQSCDLSPEAAPVADPSAVCLPEPQNIADTITDAAEHPVGEASVTSPCEIELDITTLSGSDTDVDKVQDVVLSIDYAEEHEEQVEVEDATPVVEEKSSTPACSAVRESFEDLHLAEPSTTTPTTPPTLSELDTGRKSISEDRSVESEESTAVATTATPTTEPTHPIAHTPLKTTSYIVDWLKKITVPTPQPTQAVRREISVDYIQWQVLAELRQYHAEGRQLKPVNDLDPELAALSVDPDTENALQEASILEVLFENDTSFATTAEHPENEREGEAVVEISERENCFDAEEVVESQDKRFGGELTDAIRSVRQEDVAEMSLRLLETDESVPAFEDHFAADTMPPPVSTSLLEPALPPPVLSSIKARIFSLSRHANSAPPSFMPGAHVRKLRAPEWVDRSYVDPRTQREIEALRFRKAVEKGGETIVQTRAFGGKGVENRAPEVGEVKGKSGKKVMSLGAFALLMKYGRGKTAA
ncbi:hypothetical protein EIP91_009963 [Steccherinum ochraceum]|uniref:Uncharacterized protein n=1 Tax=Steccherinum ochraceum TaxID=92696 RepID=A0A4R0R117_9APHY|nr:hypothetical protein EIP91_009963 [Steccherinum ochraceum]